MTSLCLVVQLADRTSILSKGSFSVIIIDISLFSNHSPSEWFSLYKKADAAKRLLDGQLLPMVEARLNSLDRKKAA